MRVCVPGSVHRSIGSDRHGGFPIVSRRIAQALLLRPGAFAAANLEVDITLTVSIALLDYSDLPGRRSGSAVKGVRASLGYRLGWLPVPIALLAPPDLPMIVLALAPEDPQAVAPTAHD